MEDKMALQLDWDLKIELADCNKKYNRGGFLLCNNGDLILGYNQEDNYNFHKKGKIIRIRDGKIQEIFETKERLWAPIIDENENIYLTTYDITGEMRRGDNRSTLIKIGNDNNIQWKLPLKGNAESLPVIDENSIYIFDFIDKEGSGRLSKISLDGQVIWSKSFDAFIWFEPLILKKYERMLLGFRGINKMYMMDLQGNVLAEKDENSAGTITFYQNEKGNLYGCLHGKVISIDEQLDYLWEYQPQLGSIDIAPVADPVGNLYTLLGTKLLSLDSKGREKWKSKTSGWKGFQPCVLKDGNILVALSVWKTQPPSGEENCTYLEVFSNAGKNILKHKIPGFIFDVAVTPDNKVKVFTNSRQNIAIEERADKNVKIFSFRLS